MPDLKSSAIARAEYDEATAVLTVWFAGSGEVWDHYAVPRAVYEALIAAEAPGRVFTATIRDRYPARRRSRGSDVAAALRASLAGAI
jgi:hypothetical protein